MNDLIANARSLFHRAPSRRTWDDLCALLDRADLSAPGSSDLMRYCEGHLARWPDGLRVAPIRWGLTQLDGARVPQLTLARSAMVSLHGASAEQVTAFCDAPESANLRELDVLDSYTSHDAIGALTGSTLSPKLRRVGHCVSVGNRITTDCPLEELVKAPPVAWKRDGVLDLDSNYVDISRALLGPGALAIRSLTSPSAGVVCRAISRHGGPLNLSALSLSGYDPFIEDDARMISRALLPKLRSLSLTLFNGASSAKGDPLAVLDRSGLLAPLDALSLRGAHPRTADLIAACAPSHLSLSWPHARRSGDLLAGQGDALQSIQLQFGSFRGGLAASNLSSLRSLDIYEATLSIEDYQSLARSPLGLSLIHI